MLYTILITTYECYGVGKILLEENLSIIINQSYRPIQVVISDHSKDDLIKNYVESVKPQSVDIVYTKYSENYGSPCHNWNNSLKYAKGSYIQYLALDDMLENKDSVKNAVNFMNLRPNTNWFVTAHRIHPSGETFIPKWNSNILMRNTVSGPSAIIIREGLKGVKMDPEFIWYLDLDWYYRLYKEGGQPGIIQFIHWINRKHPLQLTHTVCSNSIRENEKQKLLKKYGDPLPTSA